MREGNTIRQLTIDYNYDPDYLWIIKETNEYKEKGIIENSYTRNKAGNILTSTVSGEANEIETEYNYDRSGNLTSVEFPFGSGRYTYYTYTKQGWLDTIKYPGSICDQDVKYVYDAEGNIIEKQEYLDNVTWFTTTYVYNEVNWMKEVQLPATGGGTPTELSVFKYEYDPVGNIEQSLDAYDNAINYTYDELNRLTQQNGPLTNQQFNYIYNDDNLVEEIIGQQNEPEEYTMRSYKYGYDDNGRLTAVEDPNGISVWYRYYDNDQLQEISSPALELDGATTARRYEYDSIGRIVGIEDAAGASTSYTYRDDDLICTVTTANKKVTKYEYDDIGRIVAIKYPEESCITYEYDGRSNINRISGPDGLDVKYNYDNRNRLEKVQRLDELVVPEKIYETTYKYDNLNRLISVIDPRACMINYSYDEQSRLVQTIIDKNYEEIVTDGYEYTYSYNYDLNGRVITIIDPNLDTTEKQYNHAGQVISVEFSGDGKSWITQFEYDLWGMLTCKIAPDGTKEIYNYDNTGKLTYQENYIGEYYQYSYDEKGNNTGLQAPFGALTEFSYNNRNEIIMTSTNQVGKVDVLPVIENFDYDPTGKLRAYTGPTNEVWTMKYDDLGRWIRSTSSLGTYSERTYNKSNTLATTEDTSGVVYEMTYNGLRQRTSTKLKGQTTPAIAYIWDYLDLQEVIEGNGTSSRFEYDRLGRMVSHIETKTGGSTETTYEYNWRGQVENRTIAGSAVTEITEAYTYDARGLCTGIVYDGTAHNVAFSYDRMGRQTKAEYGSYATRQFYYNLVGRMIGDSILDASGNLYTTYYSYDKAGNRVSQILDRRYCGQTVMPAILPMDNYGNPVIHDYIGVDGGEIDGLRVKNYSAYSSTYDQINLEIATREEPPEEGTYQRVRVLTPGVDNSLGYEYEVAIDPLTGNPILIISGIKEPIIEPLAELINATPPEWNENCDIANDKRTLDFLGRVINEDVKAEEFSQDIKTEADVSKDCPSKTGVATSSSQLAIAGAGRAGVKDNIKLDSNLLNSGDGAMNQIGEPWASLLEPDGSEQKITIAYHDDHKREYINAAAARMLEFTYDNNRKITSITGNHRGALTSIFDAEHDAFGRLIGVTDHLAPGGYQRVYNNDWRTGDISLETDPATGTTWGHQHYPGHTRYTIAEIPWQIPEWELRGPQGQVKWRLDGSTGEVTDFYGYSSWGNRISGQSGTPGEEATPTRYLDGDLQLAPSMPQLKGGCTMQDMTPTLGALTGDKEAGTAGLGSSSNPDCGGGGNASFLQDKGPWSIPDPRCWAPNLIDPDTGIPISEKGKPGMGTSKEPVGSPPAAVDQASIADQRMAGMWAAQRFHGMAPGKQTGSMGIDDYRNPRLPLPAQPGIGDISGPAGFGNGDPHFTIPTPHVPGSPWGGGGEPLLNSQWDPAQRMIEKGMQNYYQKTFELAVDYAYGSTATGKHHNISPFETVIHHYDPGTSSDGASGGGGEGITAEESARLHEQAIGAPSGYFASSREESSAGRSSLSSWWYDMRQGARKVWDWYDGLPWYAQAGIDLGLALLEPGAMGEAAFTAKWAAKMGWNFLRGHADDIVLAGARAVSRSKAAFGAAVRGVKTFGSELRDELVTHGKNLKNVVEYTSRVLSEADGYAIVSNGHSAVLQMSRLGGVYKGITHSNQARYIGQSVDYSMRSKSYGGRFKYLEHLTNEILERWQRRGIEQEMFERAALTGEYLENIRNPIDRRNYRFYKKATQFGRKFVESHGLEW